MPAFPWTTTIFLNISGVRLINSKDHQACQRVADHFRLGYAELDERHRLACDNR